MVYPLFIVEGAGIKAEIPSMTGVYHLSIDNFLKELEEVQKADIPAVLLFGVPDSKDEIGSGAFFSSGIIQRALYKAKKRVPDMLLIADVCLCEYTSHGHCGVGRDGKIINDESVELIVKTALSYAEQVLIL